MINKKHIRVKRVDLGALDGDRSGSVTAKDLSNGDPIRVAGTREDGSAITLEFDRQTCGVAARVFEWMKRFGNPATNAEHVDLPLTLFRESAVDRMLLASDSYAASVRSMRIPQVLDALVQHADSKLGVSGRGLRDGDTFRSYGVVENGTLRTRQARYDGSVAFLYVPTTEPEALAELTRAVALDPRHGAIAVRPLAKEELRDPEKRLELRYDRPGLLWVSSRCPLLPHLHDDTYVVPGGRFGLELFYHDARINIPGLRSSLDAAKRRSQTGKARRLLSTMRGTVNALVNEFLHYGKVFNSTMSTSAGRSQAPCLTRAILETYRSWIALTPQESEDARIWLAWAMDAAKREYREIWMGPHHLDVSTGLSRYADETPSVAPEETPHFYEGMEWDAEDIASDAAIREHGWDSMPQALVRDGPERGRPRVHKLLPACLNSLLYRYERDFAEANVELHGPEEERCEWEMLAARRKRTMHLLMWDEDRGLFSDLYRADDGFVVRNGNEDLRCFAPLWAGLASPEQAKKMHSRVRDFMRPGGVAAATESSWWELHALNPTYTERCQWGHKDIGWPISTYEMVVALRESDGKELADEIAYRWCLMVQRVMDSHGGLHFAANGGFEGPVFEKMDVSDRSPTGAAGVGYGNQGAGREGEGGGFRWGYDAYKLLYRDLPMRLRKLLARDTPAEKIFVQSSQME